MSQRSAEDFLRDADGVIDDWQGSADSATWAADGSHEPAVRTIHFEIPGNAPAYEAEAFEEALVRFAIRWEYRAGWDPIIHSRPGRGEWAP